MKKNLFFCAAFVALSTLTFSQTDADKLKLDKSKIFSKVDRFAVAQLRVNYKLTTTAKTVGKDKSSGSMAGAKVSAYLLTTDGELTQDDFQQVTDYFYSYFQKKLKENGIDTVAWSAIEATDFYKNAKDDDEKKEDSKAEKGGNVWVTTTAHKGNVLHTGTIAFAFGKAKKAMTFSEEIGAPAGYFDITVDFADILVNVDVKSTEYKDLGNGWYRPASTKVKYSWAVNPNMTIGQADNGLQLFWNKKGVAEVMYQYKDIMNDFRYADKTSEDESKVKKNFASMWQFRKELTPVVIETTKDKYKEAARKVCEKFVEAFVAKVNGFKKNS
jgi:hypothetical protein